MRTEAESADPKSGAKLTSGPDHSRYASDQGNVQEAGAVESSWRAILPGSEPRGLGKGSGAAREVTGRAMGSGVL